MDKIHRIPFDSIGKHLDDSLANLDSTLKQVNGQVLPQVSETLKGAQGTLGSANHMLAGDSPLQQNLGATLQELQRMARSLRVLTDYLGVHPEALIRGRHADPAVHAPAAEPTPSAAPKGTASKGSKP
ncbi:hypothetical protein [Rhodanobacter sp. 115]|uniref:hypothetical protein n=1 Tax=Rhodanobacter sp. FW021-MT20 TaxID=1162282 RepID=UPI000260CE01|nr:hypothetical protein [Rhodanobacter sp. 115]EIL96429.1 paraquat-inducible protein B' [Rhodanobacter sp. 115]